MARAVPFFFALALWFAYGAAVERFPSLNLPPTPSAAGWFDGWSGRYGWQAVDGDTFTTPEGGRIRLLGVDTPELHPCHCPRECELGQRARRRTQALLNEGPVSLHTAGRDWYGRTLARVSIGGRDLSKILIAEGLGRPYDGGERRTWCSLLARGTTRGSMAIAILAYQLDAVGEGPAGKMLAPFGGDFLHFAGRELVGFPLENRPALLLQ